MNAIFQWRFSLLARAVAMLVAAASFSGCATKITSGFRGNPQAALLGAKTFAVLPFSYKGSTWGADLDYWAIDWLPRVVKAAMEERGYRSTSIGEAEVLVNIRGTGLPANNIATWGLSYTGYNAWTQDYNPFGQVHDPEGYWTIVLEAFQASDAKLAWVGWRQNFSVMEPGYELYLGTARSILADFPPAASK